jgi:peptidoglycan/LPS O-acetylase OafA/YrhL
MDQTPTNLSLDTPKVDSRSYRPDIDGLRAIAVLSVVFFHAGVKTLSGGFVGVDIFFVISGYLIGGHVFADTNRGKFSILDFYRKRAKRILPALFVLMIFCYAFSVLVLSAPELAYVGNFSSATLLSISNIRAWNHLGYFTPGAFNNPLLMTWSLGVEEQFYILFPLCMILLGKRSPRIVLSILAVIAGVSLVACIWLSPHSSSTTFFLFPFRAWELLIGVLFAVRQQSLPTARIDASIWLSNGLSIVGVTLLGFSILAFGPHTVFPGYAALAPTLGSILLIGTPSSWINRQILASRPLRLIGQISYSLYLWHWPLLSFAHIVSADPLPTYVGCILVLLSIPIAWLSYKFVEQPFRRSTTPRGPLLLKYALCCGLLMVPALLIRQTHGLPNLYQAIPDDSLIPNAPEDACVGSKSLITTQHCIDTADPRPAIALIGDSHAVVLASTLRDLAYRSGDKFYEMTKFTCPPLKQVTNTLLPQPEEEDCAAYNANALALLLQHPEVKVVLIAAFWSDPAIQNGSYVRVGGPQTGLSEDESEQNLSAGLAGTVAALTHAGKRVVLIKDVPILRFNPWQRLRAHLIPFRGFAATGHFPSGPLPTSAPLSETYLNQEQASDTLLDQVAKTYHVDTFNPRPFLCTEGRCTYVYGNHTLYIDEQHLSQAGAVYALRDFKIKPY